MMYQCEKARDALSTPCHAPYSALFSALMQGKALHRACYGPPCLQGLMNGPGHQVLRISPCHPSFTKGVPMLHFARPAFAFCCKCKCMRKCLCYFFTVVHLLADVGQISLMWHAWVNEDKS